MYSSEESEWIALLRRRITANKYNGPSSWGRQGGREEGGREGGGRLEVGGMWDGHEKSKILERFRLPDGPRGKFWA